MHKKNHDGIRHEHSHLALVFTVNVHGADYFEFPSMYHMIASNNTSRTHNTCGASTRRCDNESAISTAGDVVGGERTIRIPPLLHVR